MHKQINVLITLLLAFFYTYSGAQNLDVNGDGIFRFGNGSFSVTTPGGWIGLLAIDHVSGHRRDIAFRQEGISILASNSFSPPDNTHGVWIIEGGNTGIGTANPDGKLDIDFGMTGSLVAGTPSGIGPGWIFYGPTDDRWDMFLAPTGMLIGKNGIQPDQFFRILENGSIAVNRANGGSSGGIHLRQLGTSAITNGLALEHPTDVARWNTFIDDAYDYNFAFNGSLKSYIKDSDGTYNTFSDFRLKTDIKSTPSVLASVTQLNPVSYKFKTDPNAETRSWGFIAQEVEELFPDFVSERDGFKTLAYDNFAVLAIKAIQEQQMEIDALKRKIELLNQRSTN